MRGREAAGRVRSSSSLARIKRFGMCEIAVQATSCQTNAGLLNLRIATEGHVLQWSFVIVSAWVYGNVRSSGQFEIVHNYPSSISDCIMHTIMLKGQLWKYISAISLSLVRGMPSRVGQSLQVIFDIHESR